MKAEYQQTAEQVIRTLRQRPSARAVHARSTHAPGAFRPDQLAAERPVPRWRKFVAQFGDVLVVLLLIATAISFVLWLYERDVALPYEAMAISAVVLLNAMLGSVQQERAESAIAAPRQMACATIASTALWLRKLEKLLRRRTQVTA